MITAKETGLILDRLRELQIRAMHQAVQTFPPSRFWKGVAEGLEDACNLIENKEWRAE